MVAFPEEDVYLDINLIFLNISGKAAAPTAQAKIKKDKLFNPTS